MKRHRQQGFTLMELMVVIVIVAILAAVAVPLYINYVKDAQRTEAKGAIGAIVSAQQAHYQRTSYDDPPARYGTYQDLVDKKLLDIPEADAKWDFTIDVLEGTDPGFTVLAKPDSRTGNAEETTLYVNFRYTRSEGGTFDPAAEGPEDPPSEE